VENTTEQRGRRSSFGGIELNKRDDRIETDTERTEDSWLFHMDQVAQQPTERGALRISVRHPITGGYRGIGWIAEDGRIILLDDGSILTEDSIETFFDSDKEYRDYIFEFSIEEHFGQGEDIDVLERQENWMRKLASRIHSASFQIRKRRWYYLSNLFDAWKFK